ncbi:MAG: hypothetical protein ACKOYH_06815 [Cyanobium sp.]
MPNHEDEEEQHLATLDELQTIQAQINSYQGLLKDLPEIFERKFNERLQPHLDRQQQLLDEREQLLYQLHQYIPQGVGGEATRLLPSFTIPPEEEAEKTAVRQRTGRFLWILGLAGLGCFLGVYLSQQFRPGKSSNSTPSTSLNVASPPAPAAFIISGDGLAMR